MKIINLKLSDYQHKTIKALATSDDTNMQSLIVELLSDYVKKKTGDSVNFLQQNLIWEKNS